MISPEHALIAGMALSGIHTIREDLTRFEINPYVAGFGGACALLFAGTHGAAPLASTLCGIGIMGLIVLGLRCISTNWMGAGDYALFMACGAITGVDAILPFFVATGAFALILTPFMPRLGDEAGEFAGLRVTPAALAAVPAVVIAGVARYLYDATFMQPYGWAPL